MFIIYNLLYYMNVKDFANSTNWNIREFYIALFSTFILFQETRYLHANKVLLIKNYKLFFKKDHN